MSLKDAERSSHGRIGDNISAFTRGERVKSQKYLQQDSQSLSRDLSPRRSEIVARIFKLYRDVRLSEVLPASAESL